MAKVRKTGRVLIADEEEKIVKEKDETTITQLALTEFIDSIDIGEEIVYKNVKVFPIFLQKESIRDIKLKTLEEALKENILEIKETNVVSQLTFINKSKTDKILIVEGDIVQGGRQNRVVNVTMVVDEDSTVTVPTSCVEQNRWSFKGDVTFSKINKLSPSLYADFNTDVYKTMQRSKESGEVCYASNQSSLWGNISTFLCSSNVSSNTASYSDSYENKKQDITLYVDKILPHIKECCGIAAIIGKKLVVSICDSIELFMPQLKTLLQSYIIEALLNSSVDDDFNADKLVNILNKLKKNKIDLFDSPNKIGKTIKFSESYIGSAFLYNDKIVHLTFVK